MTRKRQQGRPARRTSLRLPGYTRRKPLADGRWGYYFEPPTWARRPRAGDDRGPCPVGSEHLGTDYDAAVCRVETVLLPLFDNWRTRGAADLLPNGPRRGTLDWLFLIYRSTDKFTKLGAKVQQLYADGMRLVANYPLKDGRRLGEFALIGIDAVHIDKLYNKLLPLRDANGNSVPLIRDGVPVFDRHGKPVHVERRTTVNHAMKTCRRAWNVVARLHPADVPPNPFAAMGLVSNHQSVVAAAYVDLVAAVAQADAQGMPSLGTALMVTWEWLQREEHIFTAFELSHYRPPSHPNEVYIVHPKNGQAVWIPLFDGGTALFPELMARMDALKRNRIGTGPFFVRDWPDHNAGVPLPWVLRSGSLRFVVAKTRKILDAIELPPEITFTSFRHGGLTELGDAELTDAQIRAISRHKSTKVLTGYVKRTQRQIIDGTHRRRATRPAPEKPDDQLDLFGGKQRKS